MRTVLIGSDFMYDKDGNLKPIEINTAVGWDGPEKVEEDIDCLDLTALDAFIKANNFTSIHYIGQLEKLDAKLKTYCDNNSIIYAFHIVGESAITIPYIDDNAETLIIRSAYDTTALVDDTYCRDKVNFMNLIKDSTFGSQFAYMNESNTLVNNITNINDNGEHPNFILKARYPGYDKEQYPKFYKVSNQTELDVVLENVTSDYFLMEYLYNPTKKWEGHSFVLRSLNILYPATLESIQIGQYTKLNQNMLLDNVTYNSTTFEVDTNFKSSYNTVANTPWLPKLVDTDEVELSDGTFKTALELQIGDVIKTIEIPNENGLNIDRYITNTFGSLDYNTLASTAIYSNNIVTNKQKVNVLTFLNTLTFEDNSTWEDTMGSRYLIEREGIVVFHALFNLIAGDVVLLLDTTDGNISFVRKTIVSNIQSKRVFSGWFISVDKAMLFLTKTTGSTNNQSYVSIEHNSVSCPGAACSSCYSACESCPKNDPYCYYSTCVSFTC
jgi:hypothetical protein